jgi:hypothetical protein
MTHARSTIVARYPLGGLLIFLLILLVADYLCVDLRFIHYIVFASSVSANSPWFWPIFGAFIALTLFCAKQILFTPVLLKADLSGLELGHRALRRKIRVDWENVLQINRGQVEFPSDKGRGVMPAIRFVVSTKENLGGVISNMTQADGNVVCFAASLFEDDVDATIDPLHEIRASALGHTGRAEKRNESQ